MTEKEIRLECLNLAIFAKRKSSKLVMTDQALAEIFCEFCKADDVKFKAMEMAVKNMKPRIDTEDLLQAAFSNMKFADGPRRTEKKGAYQQVYRNRSKSRQPDRAEC